MSQVGKLRMVFIVLTCAFLNGTLAQQKDSPVLSATTNEEIAPPVVAMVEGLPVSAKLYRMFLRNGIEALGLKTHEDDRNKMELLKEGIISDLIDRVLVEGEARRRNLSISKEALDGAYERRVAGMGGEKSFRAYLAENGMSSEDFRQMIELELYGPLLKEALNKEVSVTEDEVQTFYDQEKNNPTLARLFVEPERAHARHILISARPSLLTAEIRSKGRPSETEVQRRLSEEMARRRRRAAEILSKARSGEDFERLAQQYSEDLGTRDLGGNLGRFTRNTHAAAFDQAVFALNAGQISDLVQTDYGFHIIQVLERTPKHQRTRSEASSDIQQYLLTQKQAKHLNVWLANRRREANIQINPVYRVGRYQLAGR